MNFYETHITFKTNNITLFKEICSHLSIKPIILELQNKIGNVLYIDVMTSQKLRAENIEKVLESTSRIEKEFLKHGMVPIRTKIECPPDNIFVPNNDNIFLANQNNYFESHIRVIVDNTSILLLRNLFLNTDVHISRNVFKIIDERKYYIMLTYRKHFGKYEEFEQEVNYIMNTIKKNEFISDKKEIEFILYDSNLLQDTPWLEEIKLQ